MKSSTVVPEQPRQGLILGLASGLEALPVQPLAGRGGSVRRKGAASKAPRPPQRLAGGAAGVHFFRAVAGPRPHLRPVAAAQPAGALYAPAHAVLDALLVANGQAVPPGQPLLRLSSAELDLRARARHAVPGTRGLPSGAGRRPGPACRQPGVARPRRDRRAVGGAGDALPAQRGFGGLARGWLLIQPQASTPRPRDDSS